MGRFDRYILGQLIRVFGFFALVLVGVYWINRAVILLERYLAEGQSGALVLQLTLLSIPAIMVIVLPVAGFVAAAYTTNRLHGDSELVVVQATGYSAARLARPFITFALAVTLLLSALAHGVVPMAMRQLGALEERLAAAISARLLVPGTFQSPADGVTVYVREILPDGTLEGLLLFDRREVVRETTYTADRGLLVRTDLGPRLVMFTGMAQTLEIDSGKLSTTVFDDFTVSIDALVSVPPDRRRDYRGLTTQELFAPSAMVLAETRRSRSFLRREGHQRFTEPLLAGAAVLLGYAALMVGGFSRFGLMRQIVLAVLLVVLAKLLDNAAIDFVKSAPQLWGVLYAPAATGVVISLGLIGRADGWGRGKAGRPAAP